MKVKEDLLSDNFVFVTRFVVEFVVQMNERLKRKTDPSTRWESVDLLVRLREFVQSSFATPRQCHEPLSTTFVRVKRCQPEEENAARSRDQRVRARTNFNEKMRAEMKCANSIDFRDQWRMMKSDPGDLLKEFGLRRVTGQTFDLFWKKNSIIFGRTGRRWTNVSLDRPNWPRCKWKWESHRSNRINRNKLETSDISDRYHNDLWKEEFLQRLPFIPVTNRTEKATDECNRIGKDVISMILSESI